MRKLVFVIVFLGGICTVSQGQEQHLLFDQALLRDTIKLIGMYPQYDKYKTYERYNFFIKDKKVIDSLVRTVKYGARTQNVMEQNDFSIIVTKNNKIIDRWSISPKFKNINTDGESNAFDINILADLAARFPLKYEYSKKVFASENQYNQFEASMLQKNNMLFIYKPDFRYEGSFELEFDSSQFPNADEAIKYIDKKLKGVIQKSKYSAVYILTDYNLLNQNQITITVSGPKRIFESFNDKKAKKKLWTPAEFDAMIFEKM